LEDNSKIDNEEVEVTPTDTTDTEEHIIVDIDEGLYNMANDLSISESCSDVIVASIHTVVPTEVDRQYGRLIKRSSLCVVCQRIDHREINLMRARDHNTLGEIELEKQIPKRELRRHFENHFILTESNQEIINLRENTDSEKREIITKAFEGNLDVIEGASSILKSMAERLSMLRNRMRTLSDGLETETLDNKVLDNDDRNEFLDLNRECTKIEKEMLKAYEVIDKKLFPPNKEDLYDAVLSYKLDILSKMLDQIWIEFSEFERKSEAHFMLIQELKEQLAIRFNRLEDEILKSGGILRPSNK
jgi:hypothetical protein